jgi:hypothetical protein
MHNRKKLASSRPTPLDFHRCIFSVQAQVEGLRQVQGGVVERQTLHGRPQIEDIPLGGAVSRGQGTRDSLRILNAIIDLRNNPSPLPAWAMHDALIRVLVPVSQIA